MARPQPASEYLIYPGPSDEVVIPNARVKARRGEPVHVPDPAVRESLKAQGWAVAPAPVEPTSSPVTEA